MDENREDAILERAAEILANEPSAAEIAEQAARARANRIAAIMTPPEVPVVFKTTETPALDESKRPVVVQHTEAPVKRNLFQRGNVKRRDGKALGGPVTETERVEAWAAWCIDRSAEDPRTAIKAITKAMGGADISIARQLAKLVREVADLRAELDQRRNASEAIGRQAERTANELATLKREFDLEKKLAAQNT